MRTGPIKCLLMLLLLLAGCTGDKKQEDAQKWQVSLHRDKKLPYGTYLAYESLKYSFPGSKIELLPDGFRYNNMDAAMMQPHEGRSLLVLQGLDLYITEREWTALKDFISNGNEVIIFCNRLDSKIEDELGYAKRITDGEETPVLKTAAANENKGILSLMPQLWVKYGYEGRSLQGYFAKKEKGEKGEQKESGGIADPMDSSMEGHVDSSIAEIDGKTVNAEITGDTLGYSGSNVNFMRFYLGKGHITFHAAPLVLSNYFLLQPGNRNYLDGVWATLPDDINHVYWNEYFKRSSETSGLDVLLRYPATRMAIWLGLLAMIIYILFEGKRRQRIIPVIAPLKNDSVSFVETVGRLYYNKGNHANLAGKMTQQFLEWVRMHYFLNTNLLNESFIQQLMLKSGQPEAAVRELMNMIHEVRLGSAKIDDAYLYQLYNTIQQFYKKRHR